MDTLLGYWALPDDVVYPWRVDGTPQVAPLVTFNEYGPQTHFNAPLPYAVNDLRSPIADACGISPFSTGNCPTTDGSGFTPGCSCWTPTYVGGNAWTPTYDCFCGLATGRAGLITPCLPLSLPFPVVLWHWRQHGFLFLASFGHGCIIVID